MLYPLTFCPIFHERVWGGRRLAELYAKPLPAGKLIGESWEISDRPEAASVIANGPLAGRTLRWLMEHHRDDLLGKAAASSGRFPLLIKLLDAREKLSLQVHPPAGAANLLGGEPKTELWYIAQADPGAELFVGLRRGVTRDLFASRLEDGTVADCFHRLPVRAGDVMFLPSGRVHAIGAGLVIFEIQQNSDTTYRVFDWNRAGLDGKPRELHLDESLASIDFNDFEPRLAASAWESQGAFERRTLVSDPLFAMEAWRCGANNQRIRFPAGLRVLAVVEGGAALSAGGRTLELIPGQFALIPAVLNETVLQTTTASSVLLLAIPGQEPG